MDSKVKNLKTALSRSHQKRDIMLKLEKLSNRLGEMTEPTYWAKKSEERALEKRRKEFDIRAYVRSKKQ